VANPDLPLRIKEGLALTPYARDTFYTFDSVGYNDYPFVNELASPARVLEEPTSDMPWTLLRSAHVASGAKAIASVPKGAFRGIEGGTGMWIFSCCGSDRG
jgi:hypothetical protein